jgi:hypothetical protein
MVEIHLNRTGINSVDTPDGPVEVQAGSLLRLKLINHGAPIHLTLSSSNAQPFTDFYHQNVYVREETIFDVPIREDAFPGSFDVTVITGYGTVRATLKVTVLREPPRPQEPPQRPRYPALAPPERTLPPVVLLFAAAGLVLYLVWWITRLDVVNFAAFLLLLAGIAVGWLTQRS